jgi:hypothetical protein
MSAVYWNLIPLTFDEVAEIIKYCEARCLGHYLDTEGKSDLIIIVVNYIIDNLDKFIELPQEDLDDDTFKNAPGFYTRENGNIAKLMFHPPTFRKAMASARPQQVLEALYKGEYIICDFGSYQKKYQVGPAIMVEGTCISLIRTFCTISRSSPFRLRIRRRRIRKSGWAAWRLGGRLDAKPWVGPQRHCHGNDLRPKCGTR